MNEGAMAEKRVHLTIRGGVQGVGFRAWTLHQAQLRSLSGWVRNRADGTVEAVFAGPADAVALMVEVCRVGPAGSRVDAVEIHSETPGPPPADERGRFEVRPTA